MVKKILLGGIPILAACALFLTGCDKGQPVLPRENAALVLSVPKPLSTKPKASFTLGGLLLEYRLVSTSGEVVSGSIDTSAFAVGSVTIPVPHNGKWLVSAEWIYNSDGVYPVYIGADEADIQGTTAFTLNLGALSWSCYKADMADLNSFYTSYNYLDLFSFDSYQLASSAVTNIGDVMCVYDAATTVEYLTTPAGTANVFAYLGTGDWVNYTSIPPGTTYYPDSLSAKRAIKGMTAYTDYNDVYVVKLSPTQTAWLQMDVASSYPPYTYLEFFYRVNHHGDPFLKFDVTTYGDANCNQSGTSLY